MVRRQIIHRCLWSYNRHYSLLQLWKNHLFFCQPSTRTHTHTPKCKCEFTLWLPNSRCPQYATLLETVWWCPTNVDFSKEHLLFHFPRNSAHPIRRCGTSFIHQVRWRTNKLYTVPGHIWVREKARPCDITPAVCWRAANTQGNAVSGVAFQNSMQVTPSVTL